MKPNAQYRLVVYLIISLVYFVKTKWDINKLLPEQLKNFIVSYHNEILFVCYTFLVYYYYALELD